LTIGIQNSYTLQVRSEPHLSVKSRCSEASQFLITKMWYAYYWFLECRHQLAETLHDVVIVSSRYYLHRMTRCLVVLLVMNATFLYFRCVAS